MFDAIDESSLYNSVYPHFAQETARNFLFWTSKNFDKFPPVVWMVSVTYSDDPHFGQTYSLMNEF